MQLGMTSAHTVKVVLIPIPKSRPCMHPCSWIAKSQDSPQWLPPPSCCACHSDCERRSPCSKSHQRKASPHYVPAYIPALLVECWPIRRNKKQRWGCDSKLRAHGVVHAWRLQYLPGYWMPQEKATCRLELNQSPVPGKSPLNQPPVNSVQEKCLLYCYLIYRRGETHQ